jgi:hypothetical protein
MRPARNNDNRFHPRRGKSRHNLPEDCRPTPGEEQFGLAHATGKPRSEQDGGDVIPH